MASITEILKNIPIQIKRGSTVNISKYTGLEGELVYNRDTHNLHVMDGTTVGGFPVGSLTKYTSELVNDSGFITKDHDNDFTASGNISSSSLQTGTLEATQNSKFSENLSVIKNLNVGGNSTFGNVESTSIKCTGNTQTDDITSNTGTIKELNSDNITASDTVHCGVIDVVSDIRHKSDIKKLEDIDTSSLSAYSYFLNGDTDHRRIGLIAQEVQKVLPEAVNEREDGTLSIDYNAVVAVLVNKINKLEEKIKNVM